MFGECFDFAPKLTKAERRKQYVPSVQVSVKQTPKEQANKLASSVGVDPTLLDGIPQWLLESSKVGDLRAAMYFAVNSLQQGKHPMEIQEKMSLGEFMVSKIGRLPLGSRFPLMAEWSANLPAAWNKAPQVESSFISFDSVPGSTDSAGGGSAAHRQDPLDREKSKAIDKKPEKVAEKKRKTAPVTETYGEEEDAEWQDAVEEEDWGNKVREWQKQQQKPVEASPPVLAEIRVDNEQMQKEAARRQEEAKSTASKVLLNLQATQAAVQAGLRAAKRSQPPASKETQRAFLGQGASSKDRPAEEDEAPVDKVRDRSADGTDMGRDHADSPTDAGRHAHRRRRRRADPIDGDDDHEYNDRRKLERGDERSYGRQDRKGSEEWEEYRVDDRDQGRERSGRGGRFQEHDRGNRHDRGQRRDDYEQESRYERGRRGGRVEERADGRSCSYDDGAAGSSHRKGGGDSYRRRADSRSRHHDVNRGSRSDQQDEDGAQGRPRSDAPKPEDVGNARQGGPTPDPASKRKRNLMELLRATKSVSPARAGQMRKTEALAAARSRSRDQPRGKQRDSHRSNVARAFTENTGSPARDDKRNAVKTATPGKDAPVKGAPAAKAAASADKDGKPSPNLRQLAFKEGWAEYVDSVTQQHWFQNIFTKEWSKTKPAEANTAISEAQNQRRLQWLAGHRQMQIMSDLGMSGMMGKMPMNR